MIPDYPGSKLLIELNRPRCRYLRELLADGPVPYTEVTKAARACGISEPTLQRAKRRAGVESRKIGFAPAKWMWALRRGSPRE